MPLQIRRGSSLQRLAITPLDGELIWDQTEKRLYVGDGAEVGGTIATGYNNEDAVLAIGSALDSGIHDGISFSYDGDTINASLISPIREDFFPSFLNVSIIGDDSSTIIDKTSNSIYGDLFGNSTGIHEGIFFTQLLSIDNNIISLDNSNDELNIQNSETGLRTIVKIRSDSPDYHLRIDGLTDSFNSSGELITTSRTSVYEPDPVQSGDIIFKNVYCGYDGTATPISSAIIYRIDPNEAVSTGSVPGMISLLTYTQNISDSGKGINIDSRGYVSILHEAFDPVFVAREALDVNGGGIFEDQVTAPAFVGSLIADDSTTLIDATTGEILGPIRDISVLGSTSGTPVSNPDSLSPSEWLTITVNGAIRYIPLYT